MNNTFPLISSEKQIDLLWQNGQISLFAAKDTSNGPSLCCSVIDKNMNNLTIAL